MGEMTSMNATGLTSMNTTGVTSADDNISDIDSDDEDAVGSDQADGEGTRKKLSERDIDLAIDLITDGKKDFDRSLDKVSDEDLDEDEDEDELNQARDIFIEAHVERSNPPRSQSPATTMTTTNKETLDYTVEDQKSTSVDIQKSPAASNMYTGSLQDISDNEFSDKDEEEMFKSTGAKSEGGKKSVDEH